MPPAPPTPVPGNLTVPPLFGWWEILVLLVVVVAVAVLAFLFLGAGPADSGRSEWRAFLEGRSHHPESDDSAEGVSADHVLAQGAADR